MSYEDKFYFILKDELNLIKKLEPAEIDVILANVKHRIKHNLVVKQDERIKDGGLLKK